MKPSHYNFFFPYEADDNKVIAYNAFSNALALMETKKYEIVERFSSLGVPIEDVEFVSHLKKGKYLIEDDCTELDNIRYLMYKGRFNTDSLRLTIAPTADCNFYCSYCYENGFIKSCYMNQETENNIIKFINKYVNSISFLTIHWFGGEPLMNISTVERLSKKIIQICKNNNVDYNAFMVSNGYLLNNQNVHIIKECKIKSIQITLDGNKETHDKRRILKNGDGTFDVIINNIKKYKKDLPEINLRINIDKNNRNAVEDVKVIIKEKNLHNKVKIHLGRVITDNKSNCFDVCGFSKEELSFFKNYANNELLINRYPMKKSNYCGADFLNAFVISSDGNIYKCWHDIGKLNKKIGNINNSEKEDEAKSLKYMIFDPTQENSCSTCKILPICMGGCPENRNNKTDCCSIYKYILNEYLNMLINNFNLIHHQPQVG